METCWNCRPGSVTRPEYWSSPSFQLNFTAGLAPSDTQDTWHMIMSIDIVTTSKYWRVWKWKSQNWQALNDRLLLTFLDLLLLNLMMVCKLSLLLCSRSDHLFRILAWDSAWQLDKAGEDEDDLFNVEKILGFFFVCKSNLCSLSPGLTLSLVTGLKSCWLVWARPCCRATGYRRSDQRILWAGQTGRGINNSENKLSSVRFVTVS